jgi:hypothetical protein
MAILDLDRFQALRVDIHGGWLRPRLVQHYADLSPDAQRQVEEFIRRLAESPKPVPKRKLNQGWAGALKQYRDQYTSLQLQQNALESRVFGERASSGG